MPTTLETTTAYAAALTARRQAKWAHVASLASESFEVIPGRVYLKIVHVMNTGGQSVVCFVRKTDGRVFRAKSFKSKGRDLRITIETALDNVASALSTGCPNF